MAGTVRERLCTALHIEVEVSLPPVILGAPLATNLSLGQRRRTGVFSRVNYTIKHIIEIDVDAFWKDLFFDPEFNRAFFVDFLEFTTYDVLEQRSEPDGTIHRRVDCMPKVDLPAPVRKLFGDSVRFVEIGRYDPAKRRYFVEAVPRVGAERVKTTSEIWVEPAGDKRCQRIVNVHSSVKAFGMGSLIEAYLQQQTRDLYEYSADFANRWTRERGL